jgi:hypothetical protein
MVVIGFSDKVFPGVTARPAPGLLSLPRAMSRKIQVQQYCDQSREGPAVLNRRNYGEPVGELHFRRASASLSRVGNLVSGVALSDGRIGAGPKCLRQT